MTWHTNTQYTFEHRRDEIWGNKGIIMSSEHVKLSLSFSRVI